MTPERWKRIEELYQDAFARPRADRPAFLAEACDDDPAMRRDVESLLAESDSDDGFLAGPALGVSVHGVSDRVLTTMVGTSLGGYQLQALLGTGGMGEIYKAHDPKLGRDVAIKILPSAFTSHPDRLARFEREARMLASLNHPNICGIHGVEESSGIRFLILELVEGATLADTLAETTRPHGKVEGLPLDRVRAIARQVTDGLEVAHDKGIIHRDLKPANIKITPDGVVKVLDFGLAKAVGGDQPSPDLSNAPLDAGGRREGAIIGTAAYMSPEQARGLPVDRRTDIWAFGCVLYEMLTGRVAFAGDTVSDSIARILEREPDWSALPPATPASIRRLLVRCLAKDPKQRLRDIADVRIEIDAADELPPVEAVMPVPVARARRLNTWLPWVALAVVAAAVGARETRRLATAERNPPAAAAGEVNALAGATFSWVTNWPGTEEQADISPDGRFVAFVADRLGQFDVWVSQLGTGAFANLTPGLPPMVTSGNILRTLGFNGDGSEVWFSPSGNPAAPKVLVPLTGGTPRPFLAQGNSTPAWSPQDTQVAYIVATAPGDPLFIADRTGANPVEIELNGPATAGLHTHNPVWSADGQWIYFVHGTGPTGRMDIWRMHPSGQSPQQLTDQHTDVNFLAPLDLRTLLYVARAEDGSGPWLWALDVESKITRRVTVGLEQYTSVSASRDGRRVVATVAKPTASLWQMPLRDGREDGEAQPYPLDTERALAPRFAGTSLFYLSLSTRGTGDGLWRVQNGHAFEVTKGVDRVFSGPPAVSPDGLRVAVAVRYQGERHLAVMSADGTSSRTLAASIELEGGALQSAADWSPDGTRIVTSGRDGEGPGLFVIPVDGGDPVRLVAAAAYNPVWSPRGDLIVYASGFGGAGGTSVLRGVRPDGTPVQLPDVPVRVGGAHRFLPSGMALVYLPNIESKDFWLVDLATNETRQLTHLTDRGFLNTFDITPDGKHLVFDRSQQNSDVVLIDLPKK